jgi:hypothetical protein
LLVPSGRAAEMPETESMVTAPAVRAGAPRG